MSNAFSMRRLCNAPTKVPLPEGWDLVVGTVIGRGTYRVI